MKNFNGRLNLVATLSARARSLRLRKAAVALKFIRIQARGVDHQSSCLGSCRVNQYVPAAAGLRVRSSRSPAAKRTPPSPAIMAALSTQ